MSLESPARDTGRAAFTLDEFCDAYRLSRSAFYKLKAKGLAPRLMHVDNRIRITIEAATDWARQSETSSRA
jgi:hypothetical protein